MHRKCGRTVCSAARQLDLVAAYQSEQDLNADFIIQKARDDRADLGLMLGQRIAVPLVENDRQGALQRAVELAHQSKFLMKRSTVYELQNQILSNPHPKLETFQEMEKASAELIDYVKLMTKSVRFTFAFTLAGLEPGSALGHSYPRFASSSTTLSAVSFRARSAALAPVLEPSAPTAMYHNQP